MPSGFLRAAPLSGLVGLLRHDMMADELGKTIKSETGNGEPADELEHRNLSASRATVARCRNLPKCLSPQNLTPIRNFVGERRNPAFAMQSQQPRGQPGLAVSRGGLAARSPESGMAPAAWSIWSSSPAKRTNSRPRCNCCNAFPSNGPSPDPRCGGVSLGRRGDGRDPGRAIAQECQNK